MPDVMCPPAGDAGRCSLRKACVLRRPRSRIVFILAAAIGLRYTSGFGLSLRTPAVLSGATSPGSFSCANDKALHFLGESSQCRARQPGGHRGSRPRGRHTHLITCKVSAPKRYGSSDWLENMANLPKSRLLYNIRGHLVFNTAFAFLVSMVHFLTPQHIIDDLHVSPIPHSIMSGALGLLLVFRTNAAYNRFWEARQIWGTVVNTCRSLARLGAVTLGPDSEEWQEMKEYIRLFPFLLKQHLQDMRIDDELAFSRLPREEVLHLQDDPNPPLYACQLMSEVIARAYDPSYGKKCEELRNDYAAVSYRMEMEEGLTTLIDALGKCERILTTPVPRGYSRHTSRSLTVYGLTLPIVLVPHTELFTAPVVCAVCWGLFSIEEIAYFIEQPFDPDYHQLDMEAYSKKIAADVERITIKSHLGPRGRRRRRWPYSTYSISAHLATAPPQLIMSASTVRNGFVPSYGPSSNMTLPTAPSSHSASMWSRGREGFDKAVEEDEGSEAVKVGAEHGPWQDEEDEVIM